MSSRFQSRLTRLMMILLKVGINYRKNQCSLTFEKYVPKQDSQLSSAVNVAQLAERSPLTPEVCDSNSAISKILYCSIGTPQILYQN